MPAGLRQRLDDDDPGHHRPLREMPLEERLVDGDILQRADALARHALEHPIDQQERVTVRQPLEDRVDVELQRCIHQSWSCCGNPLSPRSSRRTRSFSASRRLKRPTRRRHMGAVVTGMQPGVHPWRGERVRNAGMAGHHHIIADVQVASEHHRTGDHAAGTDAGAARYAAAGRDDGVRTDLDVVRDLNLVIELDPVADDRIVDGAAIDGGVGADFHVSADPHPAELRHFGPACRRRARIQNHRSRSRPRTACACGRPVRCPPPASRADAGSSRRRCAHPRRARSLHRSRARSPTTARGTDDHAARRCWRWAQPARSHR